MRVIIVYKKGLKVLSIDLGVKINFQKSSLFEVVIEKRMGLYRLIRLNAKWRGFHQNT